MKKITILKYFSVILIVLCGYFVANTFLSTEDDQKVVDLAEVEKKKGKMTPEKRALFVEERLKYEHDMQVNPETGVIPFEEKQVELQTALTQAEVVSSFRIPGLAYTSRGPTNLGGRTRSIVVDRSDPTGNTLIAGGVSSGVFRTTNGGASWSRVSALDEIHNATTIAQDPRSGNQNTWYYGTGEGFGNSASLGAFYFGRGIWQSTNGGTTWTQFPGTDSSQTSFDSRFDIIWTVAVHPITGDLFAAIAGDIRRYDQGTSTWITELSSSSANTAAFTDVAITSSGRVYVSFGNQNDASLWGVWTSANGEGSWTRIAQDGTPTGWQLGSFGRIVLHVPEANNDLLYALYSNGGDSGVDQKEADLWRYQQSTGTWTDYSSTLPDEGAALRGNNPFAIQSGYDLVVSTKPDDEDFVIIGGTNAYKVDDITTAAADAFVRIGGYNSASSFALYAQGGDTHHPDVHAFAFDPNNSSVMYSGTDGGIHRTDNLDAGTVTWVNLNNDYQTYQYYHVAIDPQSGSDIVMGGAQDNGTTAGGTTLGSKPNNGFYNPNNQPDLTTMEGVFGGDGVSVSISRDDACVPFFFGSQLGQIARDCPGGAQDITPSGAPNGQSNPRALFVTYWYLDPDNNNALYYAGLDQLYRTTSSSTVTQGTWDEMGLVPQNIRSIAATRGTYNAATSYLFIGGEDGGVYRLADPQNAATATIPRFQPIPNLDDITPSGAGAGVVSSIAVHPTNGDIVMVSYSNYGITNIFLTTNATAASPSWTNIERNLSDFSVRSVAITESTSGTELYYVGTARGLYASEDPTSLDWVMQAPNDIGLAVVSGLRYRTADSTLLIGTHGNGMFEADIDSVTLTNIDPEYLASNQIVAYPNPAVSSINLTADNGINLNDAQFNIVNISGQVVKTGALPANRNIAVNELSSGIYFLRITNTENQKFSTKFVKR